jgi:hypothetical protein
MVKKIEAGFAAGGLFLSILDRGHKSMPRLIIALTIFKADEVRVGSCPQDEVAMKAAKKNKVRGKRS